MTNQSRLAKVLGQVLHPAADSVNQNNLYITVTASVGFAMIALKVWVQQTTNGSEATSAFWLPTSPSEAYRSELM